MDLAPGQNAPLTGTSVTVSVSGPLDLTALVLSGTGTVDGEPTWCSSTSRRLPGWPAPGVS